MTASVGECLLFCCGALCGDLAQICASAGALFFCKRLIWIRILVFCFVGQSRAFAREVRQSTASQHRVCRCRATRLCGGMSQWVWFFVCDAGWFAVLCAGIRFLPFVLHALPFGVLVFALAFARRCLLCKRFVFLLLRWHPRYSVCHSSVAPVRGGTYFSLPPQRKVGKRKRLTPPALVFA
ncbi:hypothetical protein [Paraburkholderia terrae]|uniref:hypothetical protein n=1 Tax=Paraburkholderia terrae TaxID=311230 RepID=UPI001E3AE8F9|nr:hypothetical protein [Paraburkholderia terrae]